MSFLFVGELWAALVSGLLCRPASVRLALACTSTGFLSAGLEGTRAEREREREHSPGTAGLSGRVSRSPPWASVTCKAVRGAGRDQGGRCFALMFLFD